MGMPKYPQQTRHRMTPPHVALGDVRAALGLTIDTVCARIRESYPDLNPSRGSISAIENGHRGASPRMLEAIAVALDLRPAAITTEYLPRARQTRAAS